MRTSRIVKSMSRQVLTGCGLRIDFTETRKSLKYGYGMVSAHIASEMIQTQSIYLFIYFLFFGIAKNNEKRKEKKSRTPGVIAEYLNSRCVQF